MASAGAGRSRKQGLGDTFSTMSAQGGSRGHSRSTGPFSYLSESSDERQEKVMGHDGRPRTGGTHLPKGAGEKELM